MIIQARCLTVIMYCMVRTTNQTILGFKIQFRNKFITEEFNEDEEVSFEIDEKLSFFLAEFDGSPLTAVYHFALTCSNKDLELCIVFRRLRIAECFMEPFNALFLKASDSLVTITVGRSFKMFENLLMNRNEDLISSRLSNPNLVLTHREVSLTVYFLLTRQRKE